MISAVRAGCRPAQSLALAVAESLSPTVSVPASIQG